MKKILVMCCLLVVMAMPSFAASWYWAGADHSSGQWYIDNDSVYKDSTKGLAFIWIKQVHPDGTWNQDHIGIGRNGAMMIFRSVKYNTAGEVVYDVELGREVLSVIPGTVSESIYHLVWG